MPSVKFIDHTVKVTGVIDSTAVQVLEEVAGALESQVKRNTVVKTGKTKGSWQHRITNSKGLHTAIVGSPEENAIWEEFGTGEYALNGDGRKGGWSYMDERGNWHFTYGKHPRRAFWRAYISMKNKIIKRIQAAFKRGLS